MTPKEKAEELFRRFTTVELGIDEDDNVVTLGTDETKEETKQCALILVDEILTMISINLPRGIQVALEHDFWVEVKQEIEKL